MRDFKDVTRDAKARIGMGHGDNIAEFMDCMDATCMISRVELEELDAHFSSCIENAHRGPEGCFVGQLAEVRKLLGREEPQLTPPQAGAFESEDSVRCPACGNVQLWAFIVHCECVACDHVFSITLVSPPLQTP